MSFTNTVFLFIFFPASILGYSITRLLETKWRRGTCQIGNGLLLLFSLCFFAWARLDGVINLCVYLLLVYLLGRLIAAKTKNQSRKLALAFGVVLLTAILFYYKYYNFAVESALQYAGFEFRDILVPLGISFITFSAISYLTDVYRGDAPAGNFLDVALYLSFFPKVISGPIVLWKDFYPQAGKRSVTEGQFLKGINRMIIGFAKKVILADTFGILISQIQEQALGKGIDCPTSWGCALLYMLQIYYDFSGYSDIAIGISAMFGFQFHDNFRFPYVSRSITEFWRRWHISLGTWFREYIYIPLGGNRKGYVRTLLNLGVVFLVTGIWHGAGWNYIYWGMLNGFFVILEKCIHDKAFYQKIPSVVKWAGTMMIVFFSWELFRFPTMDDFHYFMTILFAGVSFEAINYTFAYYFSRKIIVYVVIGILGATVLQFPFFEKKNKQLDGTKTGLIVKEGILLLLMAAAVITMVNSTYSPFIYFQY